MKIIVITAFEHTSEAVVHPHNAEIGRSPAKIVWLANQTISPPTTVDGTLLADLPQFNGPAAGGNMYMLSYISDIGPVLPYSIQIGARKTNPTLENGGG